MKMTMFRRYAALAGAVALCSASLYTVPMMAQGGGGGGMRMTPDQRLAAIDKAVTLTDDQKPKVKAILEADAKKMQDLMANQDPDMRTKMMAIRTDEQTQIKVLLTDDQKTKYDAYIASTSNRRGGGAPAGAPADTPPPAPPQ
jgi:protein CpxP